MELFPAIFIGGPPHSGKSVLTYSLTLALRQERIEHYVLRAYPDGEGDWFFEANPHLVRALRFKGQGTPFWVDRICADIARRHLPLLVDVGGKPTSWQEAIFGQCTHAILLTPNEEEMNRWRTYARRYGLTILAELTSVLHGEPRITDDGPILRGIITGLERRHIANDLTFHALLRRLHPLFHFPPAELRRLHHNAAPVDTVIDLSRLSTVLDAKPRWTPAHLQSLETYLPAGEPLAVYGRAPGWLYVALALRAHPAPFYQFDPRLGWVAPPRLTIAPSVADSPLQFSQQSHSPHLLLTAHLPAAYLDYAEADGLPIPPLPPNAQLILSGKIPHWLLIALSLHYRPLTAQLAIYQPQLNGAVIVHHSARPTDVGIVLPVTPTPM